MLSDNDKFKIRANISKNRTKVGQDSNGIGTSEIINSNSGKSIRMGQDFINDHRGASKYGNNKKKAHLGVKKKSVSPKRVDRKSATYPSFDMDTLLSDNNELELRANKLKDQTKVDRHTESIGTSVIISNNSGESISVGGIIPKNMERIRDKGYLTDCDRGARSSRNNKENHIVKLKITP